MINLRLMGGLGNQMSQYAYAIILAQKLGKVLYIDTSSYKTYLIRPCSIFKMTLDKNVKMYKDYDSFYYKKIRCYQKLYHIFQYIVRRYRKYVGPVFFNFVARMGHYYNFESLYYGYPMTSCSNVDVYGYFQGAQYYDSHLDKLRTEFTPRSEFLTELFYHYERIINDSSMPVCVSLRLQDDYKNNPIYNVCDLSYYKKGVNYLMKKYNGAKLFVFADDITRARELDFGKAAIYVDGVSDVEGMELMRRCKHFVISNSSFSWWGAYLCEYVDKEVISPNKWLNNDKDYSEMYFANTIKIEKI